MSPARPDPGPRFLTPGFFAATTDRAATRAERQREAGQTHYRK